jgi:hypothetical protein
MNERIEVLAEQCGFRSNPNIYDRNQSFDIAKFAELIVRECVSVAMEQYDETLPWGGVEQVKEHFGIEQ